MKKILIGLLALVVCIGVVQATIRAGEDEIFVSPEDAGIEESVQDETQEAEAVEEPEAVIEESADLTEETVSEETNNEVIVLPPTVVEENDPEDKVIVSKSIYKYLESLEKLEQANE